MDVRRERHQPLVRADVGRGLLPPDVLLARRKRQAEGPPPLGIARFSHEAARDLPLVGGPACKKAEQRAAVLHRNAERLRLPARDVRSGQPGRREQRERNRLGDDGERHRALRVRGGRRDVPVFDHPAEIGGLHGNGEGRLVDRGRQGRFVRSPVGAKRHLDDVEPEIAKVGDEPSPDTPDGFPGTTPPCAARARAGPPSEALRRAPWRPRRARRWPRPCPSAGRCASGTRRSTGACPAKPRAGTACTRSATRPDRASGRRSPRRSGCTHPLRERTPCRGRSRCARTILRAGAGSRSPTSAAAGSARCEPRREST